MAFGVAGLFFLRYWRNTRDRLFALFALSFFVMTANRVQLALVFVRGVPGGHVYWLRLLAFGLILAAVVDKNRSGKTSP